MRWLGSNLNKIAEQLVASSSYPELPIWGTFDSMEVMIEAAQAGLGFVMLPTYVDELSGARAHLRKWRLHWLR